MSAKDVLIEAIGDDAVIAALSAAGYVIVPREPTPEMLHAATMQVPTWDDDASRRKWKAMVAAGERP